MPLINFAVAAFYDPTAADGVNETYRFRIEGNEVNLTSTRGGTAEHEPDVTDTYASHAPQVSPL